MPGAGAAASCGLARDNTPTVCTALRVAIPVGVAILVPLAARLLCWVGVWDGVHIACKESWSVHQSTALQAKARGRRRPSALVESKSGPSRPPPTVGGAARGRFVLVEVLVTVAVLAALASTGDLICTHGGEEHPGRGVTRGFKERLCTAAAGWVKDGAEESQKAIPTCL